MDKIELHLLLADDDIDDCDFFMDALEQIAHPHRITIVNNGVELLNLLKAEQSDQPDLIFMDLNMPRKTGIECIAEMKASDKLSHIPIVIFSTSLDNSVVNRLYEMGAHRYIQKPGDFGHLKMVVKKAITLLIDNNLEPRSRERFIIQH